MATQAVSLEALHGEDGPSEAVDSLPHPARGVARSLKQVAAVTSGPDVVTSLTTPLRGHRGCQDGARGPMDAAVGARAARELLEGVPGAAPFGAVA